MRTLPMKVSKTGEDRRAEGGVVLKKVTLEWPFFTQLDSQTTRKRRKLQLNFAAGLLPKLKQ